MKGSNFSSFCTGEKTRLEASALRSLIVTADDFGVSSEVNIAIETAHVRGILNTASLMVASAAADDAVARARNLPALHVGLHLAVTRAPSMLPPDTIPAITDPASGRLPEQLAAAGVRFFFLPSARRQLELEIRAQFEAFAATGLELDHVNVHNHMHLHPVVLSLILKIGRDYGLHAVRLPREPVPSNLRGVGMALFLAPWIAWVQRRLRRAGMSCNDWLFGMRDSGHMTYECVLRLLTRLPPGVSEIFFHPATGAWRGMEPGMKEYEHAAELDALVSSGVVRELKHRGIQLVSFSSLRLHQG